MSEGIAIDSGAQATFVRPDITAGLPDRELTTPYFLQTVSRRTSPS
jgi:hypothetical protein